ncbi:MAG: SPOR domain-containing protein [Thermomonas sp.]|uniref:SPOR domain-containing protein n=1 Tax=Thermomonas sp. TaxID=1971895 RepID=UPI0039E4CCAB
MLLRAAIVMLVSLNLGAAAWWLLHPPVQATPSVALAPDTPTLRLLGEAVPVAKPEAAAPAVPEPPAPSIPAPAETIDAPSQVAVCLRFGPFADAAARDAARNALNGLGINALPRDTAARSARGWKVFLPPQASSEAATAMAERIKAAGVSDLYVMREGADANSIALGRYGSEEAARRRQAELRGKGVEAQAASLDNTPAQAWLDARLPANANRAALGNVAPSRELDCASLR